MKVTRKEIESVSRLAGEKRYEYFIKKAADQNQVWGLWNDGWATGFADGNFRTLPIWPTFEYAAQCRLGNWAGFEPRSIHLVEFIANFLPNMRSADMKISIFDVPDGSAVVVSEEDLVRDLRLELSKIE